MPPPRKIKLKFVSHTYECVELTPTGPIDFKINEVNIEKYQINVLTKDSILSETSVKKKMLIILNKILNTAKLHSFPNFQDILIYLV